MANIAVALIMGFLIACTVLFMALSGGSQADVGYETWEDVGSGSMDSGYEGYDVVDTYIQLELPLLANEGNNTSPIPFRG